MAIKTKFKHFSSEQNFLCKFTIKTLTKKLQFKRTDNLLSVLVSVGSFMWFLLTSYLQTLRGASGMIRQPRDLSRAGAGKVVSADSKHFRLSQPLCGHSVKMATENVYMNGHGFIHKNRWQLVSPTGYSLLTPGLESNDRGEGRHTSSKPTGQIAVSTARLPTFLNSPLGSPRGQGLAS